MTPFDTFDAVYCISIRANKNRQESARAIADQLGIPMHFYYVDKHPRGGAYGALHSHIQLVKMLYHRGFKNVLILEDDFVPTPGYSLVIMQDVVEFIGTNREWEILQLGYSPLKHVYDISWVYSFVNTQIVNKNRTIIKHIGLATHAYCLSRRGMQRIVEDSERVLALENPPQIDAWYSKLLTQTYATSPIQFDQKWCMPTDNIPQKIVEKVFYRPAQCYAEKYQVFYRLSLLPQYKILVNTILIILLAILLRIIYSIVKRKVSSKLTRSTRAKTRR